MKYLIGLFSILIAFSCSVDKNDSAFTTIRGMVNYPNNGYIFLEILTPDGYEKVDSSRLDNEHSFQLHTLKESQDIYRLNFFEKQKISLAIYNQDISIKADGNSFIGSFNGTGSSEIEVISQLNVIKNDFQINADLLGQKIKTANSNRDISELDSLNRAYEELNIKYQGALKNLILSGNRDLTSLLILFENFEIEPNLEFYNEQLPLFHDNLENHWYYITVSNFHSKVNKTAIGSKAEDFSLQGPDGRLISLSSFRGKYLFLDFWASWCQPCRIENPNLVKVYEKFVGPKFDIFGVSFDKKKENWIKAIEKDGLTWSHVSDLKYLDSEMIELYNITNVPTTFLLDPDGKIIAKNIHADALENILKEVL